MQAEVFFLVHALGLDGPANKPFYLRDKPDEDECVGHIKASVEGSQHKTQLGGIGHKGLYTHGFLRHIYIVAHHSADSIDERAEHKQNPHHSEEVEEHVRQGGSTCLRIGREGSEVRSDGRSDVLTHHQGDTLIDGQCTRRTENHGDGHHGSRRLYTEGHHTTQQQEYKCCGERRGVERAEETQQCLVFAKIHLRARHSQRSQTQEQERQTEEEVADEAVSLLINQDDT